MPTDAGPSERNGALRLNPLGPDGGKALAADMPRLRTLRLPSCELGDAGAAALAAARWPALRLLDVAHNGISEPGAGVDRRDAVATG